MTRPSAGAQGYCGALAGFGWPGWVVRDGTAIPQAAGAGEKYLHAGTAHPGSYGFSGSVW
jgi:hypothetical protein